jgi:hypothetical protein
MCVKQCHLVCINIEFLFICGKQNELHFYYLAIFFFFHQYKIKFFTFDRIYLITNAVDSFAEAFSASYSIILIAFIVSFRILLEVFQKGETKSHYEKRNPKVVSDEEIFLFTRCIMKPD